MVVLDANGDPVETTVKTAPFHPEEIVYAFGTQAGMTYTFHKKVSG